MGTTDRWFDHTGAAEWWKGIPIRAAKKAILNRAGTIHNLAKMIYNSFTVNFNDTAQGGVVIVPSDYSAIMFISPDNRIDYETCATLTLGETLDNIISILDTQPIPAWDKFATWLGSGSGILEQLTTNVSSCVVSDLSFTVQEAINVPAFYEFESAAQLFETVRTAIEPASNLAMPSFRADTAAFGFVLNITVSQTNNDGSVSHNNISMGFLFKE